MKFLKNYILSLDKNVTIKTNAQNTSHYVKFPSGLELRISDHFPNHSLFDLSIVRSFNDNIYVVQFRYTSTPLTLTTKQVKDIIFSQYWMRKAMVLAIERKSPTIVKQETSSQNAEPLPAMTLEYAQKIVVKEFPKIFQYEPKNAKIRINTIAYIWMLFDYDKTEFMNFVNNIPPTYKPNWKYDKPKRIQSYFDRLREKNLLPKKVKENIEKLYEKQKNNEQEKNIQV